MRNKLYVCSIGLNNIDDHGLKSIFSSAGNVRSAEVIIDPFEGRSRYFAYVEMETEEDAKKAIKILNGTVHSGFTLMVSPVGYGLLFLK